MTSPKANGFLLAYTEHGSKISLEEWDDWYDTEHMPHLSTIPELLTGDRWVAQDGQKPSTAVTFDAVACSVLQSPAFVTLMQNASEREQRMFRDAETGDRRAYDVYTGPGASKLQIGRAHV